jgi:hypothetical protein
MKKRGFLLLGMIVAGFCQADEFSHPSFNDLQTESQEVAQAGDMTVDLNERISALNESGNYQEAFIILRNTVLTDRKNMEIRCKFIEQYFIMLENEKFPPEADLKEILGNLLTHIRIIYTHSETAAGKEFQTNAREQQKRLQELSQNADGKLKQAFQELNSALLSHPATSTAAPNQQPTDPRVIFSKLKTAAEKAFRANANVGRACYRTAVMTANVNGIAGDGHVWPSSKKYQHKSMNSLKEAIAAGDLLPGMIVYVGRNPGTDPNSLNLANGPHWFTYVGRDNQGIDRYSDQYKTDWTLEGMMGLVPGRKVDEILDPYRRKR